MRGSNAFQLRTHGKICEATLDLGGMFAVRRKLEVGSEVLVGAVGRNSDRLQHAKEVMRACVPLVDAEQVIEVNAGLFDLTEA